MALDIIKLLPDSVANQIAAGEVVQRPASAIKELMENALDAGARQIDVVVKDAGKSLILVVDDGIGMSETDARLCFERHATSKITKADDLFSIRTMGFRGEALASIAAVAQVELKTRREEDELGARVVIEGSVVKSQELVSAAKGTAIAVKNLFYNVPGRRNFLKSNTAEMRHITEEFVRVALVNPEIGFTLNSDGKEVFHLYPSGLKQRIVGLFGNAYDQRLLAVNQDTNNVSISGFIVKAEYSKKTRGEQYFFVNKRFVKHAYLHHAIENVYSELIANDSHPGYFINIDLDPSQIDVNIHPTKTEVNFLDAKLIYAVLHASVRKAIGQHNLSPMIDFDEPQSLDVDFGQIAMSSRPIVTPTIPVNPHYNPFHVEDKRFGGGWGHSPRANNEDWRQLYGDRVDKVSDEEVEAKTSLFESTLTESHNRGRFLQLNQSYIVTSLKSGLLVIDQNQAHYRILYERYLKDMENSSMASQQELFPHPFTLNHNDASLLRELMPDLTALGFDIEMVSNTAFVVKGTPAEYDSKDIVPLIERILENYKNDKTDLISDRKVRMAKTMALHFAVKSRKLLNEEEMQSIVDQLFACSVPEVSPDGKKIFIVYNIEELKARFV